MLAYYLKSRPTLTERLINELTPFSNKEKRAKVIESLVSVGLMAHESNVEDRNVTKAGPQAENGRADALLVELEELMGSDETAKNDI